MERIYVELLVWRRELMVRDTLCSLTVQYVLWLKSSFVYTNLVRGRLVGDTQSPLLRVIPYMVTMKTPLMSSETEAAAFNRDVVEVNMRTGTGNLAPFVNGKVLLMLLPRK